MGRKRNSGGAPMGQPGGYANVGAGNQFQDAPDQYQDSFLNNQQPQGDSWAGSGNQTPNSFGGHQPQPPQSWNSQGPPQGYNQNGPPDFNQGYNQGPPQDNSNHFNGGPPPNGNHFNGGRGPPPQDNFGHHPHTSPFDGAPPGHYEQGPPPGNNFGSPAAPPKPEPEPLPPVPEGFPSDVSQLQFPPVKINPKTICDTLCQRACFPPPELTMTGTARENTGNAAFPWNVSLTCGYQKFKCTFPEALKGKKDAEKAAYDLLLFSLYPEYQLHVEAESYSNLVRHGTRRKQKDFEQETEAYRKKLEKARDDKIEEIESSSIITEKTKQSKIKAIHEKEFKVLQERRHNVDFPPFALVGFTKNWAEKGASGDIDAPDSWPAKLSMACKQCGVVKRITVKANEEEESITCTITLDKPGNPAQGTFDQFLFKINHRKHLPEDTSSSERKQLESSLREEAVQMALHRMVAEGHIESVNVSNEAEKRNILWKLYNVAVKEYELQAKIEDKYREKQARIRDQDERRRRAERRRQQNPRETDKMTKEEKKQHYKKKMMDERDKIRAEQMEADQRDGRAPFGGPSGPHTYGVPEPGAPPPTDFMPAPGMERMGGPPSIFGGGAPGLPPPAPEMSYSQQRGHQPQQGQSQSSIMDAHFNSGGNQPQPAASAENDHKSFEHDQGGAQWSSRTDFGTPAAHQKQDSYGSAQGHVQSNAAWPDVEQPGGKTPRQNEGYGNAPQWGMNGSFEQPKDEHSYQDNWSSRGLEQQRPQDGQQAIAKRNELQRMQEQQMEEMRKMHAQQMSQYQHI